LDKYYIFGIKIVLGSHYIHLSIDKKHKNKEEQNSLLSLFLQPKTMLPEKTTSPKRSPLLIIIRPKVDKIRLILG